MTKFFPGEIRNCAPRGRSYPVLYAVRMRALPEVVKVGRTYNWRSRRRTYADWNLSRGDGMLDEVIFELHDEWSDIERMETEVLGNMPFPLRYGNEWFTGDIETAVEVICRVLEAHECFYTQSWLLQGGTR